MGASAQLAQHAPRLVLTGRLSENLITDNDNRIGGYHKLAVGYVVSRSLLFRNVQRHLAQRQFWRIRLVYPADDPYLKTDSQTCEKFLSPR